MQIVFSELWKNQEGSNVLEFSLVFPMFIFILFYIIEISVIGFSMVMIENGMSAALRTAKVGKLAAGMSREELIRNTVREQSYGLMSPERLTITNYLTSFGTNSNIGPELCFEAGTGYTGDVCPCVGGYEDRNSNNICDSADANLQLGASGEVVLYTTIYRYKPLLPFMSDLFTSNGSGDVLLITGGAIRNE